MSSFFRGKKKDPPPPAAPRPEPPRTEPPRAAERPKPDPPRTLPPTSRPSVGSGDSMFSGMQVKKDAPASGMFGGLQLSSGAETPTGAAKPSAFGFLPEASACPSNADSGLSFAGLSIKDNTAKPESGGFNFSSGPAAPTSGGFNFVNTVTSNSSPPPESGGFNFRETAPAAGGFNFIEQPAGPSPELDFAGLSLKTQLVANEAKDLDFAGLKLKNQGDSRRNSAAGELDFAGMIMKTSTLDAPRGSTRLSVSSMVDATDAPLDFAGLNFKSTSRRGSINESDTAAMASSHTASNSPLTRAGGFSFQTPATSEPAGAPATSEPAGGFSFQTSGTSEPVAALPEPVPVAQPPLKPQVSVDSLDAVQASADRVLINFFEDTKALLRAEHSTRQLQSELNETIRSANERLKSNEVAVLEFIQLEDFEKADNINALIEQDKLLVKQTEEKVRQLHNSQPKRTDTLISEVVDQLEKFQELMIGFYTDNQHQMEEYIRVETNRLEEVEEALQLENDRVERALEHSKVDLDKVSEELQTIEASIHEDTKEVLLVKTEQEELKSKLDSELAELMRLLAEKKKEVDENEAALASTYERLAQARLGHEKKLKRLAETKSRMVETQQNTLCEQEALNAKREALALANTRKEEQRQEYVNKLDDIDKNRNQLAAVVVRLKAEQEAKRQAGGSGDEHTRRTLNLQQELVEANKVMENLISTLGEKESEVANHQKNIMAIEIRIPTLEAEKAAKITKRDFLGAGSLSKEIKELQQSKISAEDSIKQLKLDIEQCKSQQEQTRTQQLRLEVAIADSMVAADRHIFQKLQERRQALEGILASLASVSTSVGEADRSCLQLEIDFTQAQINSLRAKHKWTEGEVPDLHPLPPSNPASLVPSVSFAENKEDVSNHENETQAENKEDVSNHENETQAESSESSRETSNSSPPCLSKEEASRFRTRQADLQASITPLEQELEGAIASENYERAAELDAELVSLKNELEQLNTTLASTPIEDESEQARPESNALVEASTDSDATDSSTLTMHLSSELAIEPLNPTSPKQSSSPSPELDRPVFDSVRSSPAPSPQADGNQITEGKDLSAETGLSFSENTPVISSDSQISQEVAASDHQDDSSDEQSIAENEKAKLEDVSTSIVSSIDTEEASAAHNSISEGAMLKTNESVDSASQESGSLPEQSDLGQGVEQAPSNAPDQAPSNAPDQTPSTTSDQVLSEQPASALDVTLKSASTTDEPVDFGGLTFKSSASSVSTETHSGGLDFGGLTIKSPTVHEASRSSNDGGLPLEAPSAPAEELSSI